MCEFIYIITCSCYTQKRYNSYTRKLFQFIQPSMIRQRKNYNTMLSHIYGRCNNKKNYWSKGNIMIDER